MSVFIIAEAGVNHNGSQEMAMKLIEAAARAGADAVKFQTFKAETLVQKGTRKASYQKHNTGDGDQFSMLKRLELSDNAHVLLANYCKTLDIEFMSTGFDEQSIDMLLELGVKRLKVPSGELTNLPFISNLAKKNIPMILSTGMGTLDEVQDAIQCVREVRLNQQFDKPLKEMLILLHCTSNYPASFDSINLNAMHTMADKFGLPVGYSDHTKGILVAPVAVAMGATVIEKHFTLDRNLPGPDHKASLEPGELTQMIRNIRSVEQCMGDGIKAPTPSELEISAIVRRSVVARHELKAGVTITENDIILLRPGDGIAPKYIKKIIGKVTAHEINEGQCLQWDDLIL